MRFIVTHKTFNRYSRPVFLEPQTFRLCPRHDGSQQVEYYRIHIEPTPDMQTDCLDAEGNTITRAWFSGLTPTLTATTQFAVRTLRTNPFDYILDADQTRLPITYPADIQPALSFYRKRNPPKSSPDIVADFTRNILNEVDNQTLPFLTTLNHRLYDRTHIVMRYEGDSFPPEKTLLDAMGACRDLAVLFVDCCRFAGLAARFVSGYQQGDTDQPERYLHAWASVYLPHAGWRGFDPTHGLAVADQHVAVAASHSPPGAAPTSGTFRGTGVTSELSVSIDVVTESDHAVT